MNCFKYLTAFSTFSLLMGTALPVTAITADFGPIREDTSESDTFSTTINNLPAPAESSFDLDVTFFDNIDLDQSSEFLNIIVEGSDTGLDSEPETITGGSGDDTEGNFQVQDVPFQGFSGGDLALKFEASNEVQGIDGDSDLKGNITYQAVPFEAEGTMGAVALGGFLFYRHRKKRKQALSQ